jgi:hypothetical protein
MPTCPVCGRENRETYSYCEHCGSKVAASEWEEDQRRQGRSQDRGRREDSRRREESDRGRGTRQDRGASPERENKRGGRQRQERPRHAKEQKSESRSRERGGRSRPSRTDSSPDRRGMSQGGIGRRKLLAGGVGVIAAAGAGGFFLLGGGGSDSGGPKDVVREYVRYGADGENGIEDSLLHEKSYIQGRWDGLGEDTQVNPEIDWEIPEMVHIKTDPADSGQVGYYLLGIEQGEWKILGETLGIGEPVISEKPSIRVSNPGGSGNIRRVVSTSELGRGRLKCYTDEGDEYGATGATGTISSAGRSTRCESGNSVRIVYSGYTATIRENI